MPKFLSWLVSRNRALARPASRLASLWRQWPWVCPRGTIASATAWIDRANRHRDWYARQRADAWIERYAAGHRAYPLPAGVTGPTAVHFRRCELMQWPAARVHVFDGADLYGDAGVVLSRNNRVFAEFYHTFSTKPLVATDVFKPFRALDSWPRREPATVALLASPECENHYHWVFDVLPRVHLLEPFFGQIEKFAVPAALSAAQRESLALAGIGEDRLLGLQPRERLRCARLLVPSLPGCEGATPDWAIAYLRRTFAADAKPSAARKLYVARGAGSARPVLNDSEICTHLERRGFTIVHGAGMGFADQVALFRDASVVVGAHGAGFTNTVFSPHCTLVELCSPEYFRPQVFWTLARACGHDYGWWMDDETTKTGSAPYGAIRVPLATLDQLLSFIA